ncbi:MAG: DUF4270 domain-containing protein [Bacteroidales bacterium]|nr:DUF4270 domain-containing protein [Bacteroidales bacterium]
MIKLLKTINHWRPQRSAAILGSAFWIVLLGLGITSCTKKPSLVGNKLLPDSALNVFFTDTASIRTYSVPVDTTITDHKSVAYVGSIKDPVFGVTTAGFYSQFIQIITYNRFGTNPQPDSLVLQLAVDTVYGDTTQPMTLHVYEIDGDIYNHSTYNSNSQTTVLPTDYGNYTFYPHNRDTIVMSAGDTLKNVIRINLTKFSKALAEKLMQTDTSYLDSNNLFIHYFKGLYITATPVTSGGAMAVYYPYSTNSLLTLYYHNDSTDSLQFHYGISDSCAIFNRYQHDYNTASPEFIKQVVQKDTTLGQQQFYVQGLGGIETMIKFPNIKKFARMGDISIHEAKLVLPGAEVHPFMGEPASLSLIQVVTDSTYRILNDQLIEGSTFFGGGYAASTNSYTFRITHYIQSLIQDTTQQNIGLMLYVTNNALVPQRYVFNGPKPVSDTLSRARLEILYTKLPPK